MWPQRVTCPRFSIRGDVGGIRQVGKGEGIAQRTEEEEETAGSDPSYLWIIPSQGKSGEGEYRQEADQHWRRIDIVGGGHADEPGGAEGDKGHGHICDGGRELRGVCLSLSWSAVYNKSRRGRGASQLACDSQSRLKKGKVRDGFSFIGLSPCCGR
jgi:hypothetical protein